MLLKNILFFIGSGMILISPAMAQTTPEIPGGTPSANMQLYKQELQQLRSQIAQAIQSGNQQQVQQLKGQENALVLETMQEMHTERLAWLKAHPPAQGNNPNDQWVNAQTQLKIQMQDAINSGDTKTAQQLKDQLVANAQQRFAQVRANRKAWLQAHPQEAAQRTQHEQFVKSQLPLFYELGAAIKSGDTQKAQQIRAQMAAARQQWVQSGQTP